MPLENEGQEGHPYRSPFLREGLVVLVLAAATLYAFFQWYRHHSERGENLSKETYSELYESIRGIASLCSSLEEHGIRRVAIVPKEGSRADASDLSGASLLAAHISSGCRGPLEVRMEERAAEGGEGRPTEDVDAVILEDNLNDRYYDSAEYEAYLEVEVRYSREETPLWKGVIPLLKPKTAGAGG